MKDPCLVFGVHLDSDTEVVNKLVLFLQVLDSTCAVMWGPLSPTLTMSLSCHLRLDQPHNLNSIMGVT